MRLWFFCRKPGARLQWLPCHRAACLSARPREIPGIDVHPDGVTAYPRKIVQAVLLEGRQIVSSFAGIADKSQESIQYPVRVRRNSSRRLHSFGQIGGSETS